MVLRSSSLVASGLVLLLALLASSVYGPDLRRTGLVLGVFRKLDDGEAVSAEGVSTIRDTMHCEDLHYHDASKLLFTACEDNESTRYSWFPPLANFDDPDAGFKARGSIKVIDPKTSEAKTLRFENFEPPFITHGIDVIDDLDREEGEAVYIFAVNHKPSRQHFRQANASAPRSHSVVEVFHHVIGTDTVRHLRSVWHPLLTTPNDIIALSPTSILVTNDHHYRSGWQRMLEDMYFEARWSTTVHLEFTLDGNGAADDSHEVKGSVSLTGLHNNNGLGHGKSPEDVLIGSAASGVLHLGTLKTSGSDDAPHAINVVESIELDSTIDNPSYFSDPWANTTFDASGFVVCGLTRAVDLSKNSRDPHAKDGVMVWKVTPQSSGQQSPMGEPGRWSKRLLFQDDGTRIRSSSSAVLVAAEPVAKEPRRRAQLFVTGFLSKNIVSVWVNL